MVCCTPTLKTATNSKETRGNVITHPHSYLLTPDCFQSVITFNGEEGSTTTHLHLLQLSFQLLQVMARSDKETTTTFSSLQLTRRVCRTGWKDQELQRAIEVGAVLRGSWLL